MLGKATEHVGDWGNEGGSERKKAEEKGKGREGGQASGSQKIALMARNRLSCEE